MQDDFNLYWRILYVVVLVLLLSHTWMDVCEHVRHVFVWSFRLYSVHDQHQQTGREGSSESEVRGGEEKVDTSWLICH